MRTIIDVITRSFDEVETAPGIFEYDYQILTRIPATIQTKSYANQNNNTINTRSALSGSFNIFLPNDTTDRVNRIMYIVYMGNVYNVSNITVFPPRVVITPGDRFAGKLTDLIPEGGGVING